MNTIMYIVSTCGNAKDMYQVPSNISKMNDKYGSEDQRYLNK